MMKLTFCLTGKLDPLVLDIEPSKTIIEIKEIVGIALDIKDTFDLAYNNELLVDHAQIQEYDISKDTMIVIHLNNGDKTSEQSQEIKLTFPERTDVDLNSDLPENFEEMVSNLIELGFKRETVIDSLKASYFSPDQAYELLTSESYNDTEVSGEEIQPTEIPPEDLEAIYRLKLSLQENDRNVDFSDILQVYTLNDKNEKEAYSVLFDNY